MSDKPHQHTRARAPHVSALKVALAALAPFIPAATATAAEPPPVSFHKEIMPLFRRSCLGCHNPEKADGKLDMSTRETMLKGGKTDPLFVPGDPDNSYIMEMITGEEPAMPKKGAPLSADEVALIERWIKEGSIEDPPPAAAPEIPEHPPVYIAPAVIADLEYSPDGALLAVTGFHEVLLWKSDGSERVARLLGASPQVKSLAFSPDGSLLAVTGGSPYSFGEAQIWDVATRKLLIATKFGKDTLFGVSFSPDGKRIAFGMTDNSMRLVDAATGKEVAKFESNTDWTLNTTFTHDGARILSGSRDMAMKLFRIDNGQFIDDINNPLDQILAMDRHPGMDVVAYGGEQGIGRVYRMSDNQGRTFLRLDNNLLMTFDRLPGAIHAVAYSPDGSSIAYGGAFPEIAIFPENKKEPRVRLTGHQGAVFAIDYAPDGKGLAAGGFDGMVRLYDPEKPEPVKQFEPAPILTREKFIEAVGLDAPKPDAKRARKPAPGSRPNLRGAAKITADSGVK